MNVSMILRQISSSLARQLQFQAADLFTRNAAPETSPQVVHPPAPAISAAAFAGPDQALAHELIQLFADFDLPVNHEQLLTAMAALRQAGNTASLKNSLAAARALGLPIKPAVLQPLAAVLYDFASGKTLSQLKFPAFDSFLAALVNPNVNNVAAELQKATARLGHRYEKNLARALSSGESGPIAPSGDAATVKETLLRLAEESADTRPALEQFVGQQLLHGMRGESSPFAYHHFSVPLRFENGQEGSADIQLATRREGGRKLDAGNCMLYIRLDLPSLGRTDVALNIVERVVSVRFLVSPAADFPLSGSDIEQLRSDLQAAGYRLGKVSQEPRTEQAADPVLFLLKELRIQGTSFDRRT